MSKYNLLDFFPNCVLPSCEQFTSGVVHQHILPQQKLILDSTAKYLYCQGGVGSAKSIAFAVKSVYLSLTIPENVGIVSRRDFKLLYKSSWLDIKQIINRLVQKGKIPQPKFTDKRQGDYTTILFHNGSVMHAMQGKNWSEGLGASYGWYWVDDAMESYEEMFIGNETSAGLLSRLRLPHVHYDKATYSVTDREHGSLHGMVSSNPPQVGHWLHKLFGNKPGMYKIGEDSVEWIQVATHENPFVGADYAKGLLSVQKKMGKGQNTARRVIFGESVPAYGGVKVFPQFEHSRHVAPLQFDPKLPLVRAWDFGTLHPAVVFSNLYKCAYGRNHYLTLSEIADCFNITVYSLYDDYVLPHTNQLYGEASLIVDAGDRAGYRAASSNKDRRGDMKILIDEYHLAFKHRYINLTPSLQYMAALLEPKKQCDCGLENVLISNNCPVLIGALEGGYKYSKNREGKVSDKPIEDRYFADVACAWRYGAENFVKWGISWEDEKGLLTQQETDQHRLQRSHSRSTTPWSWMELSDEDFGKLLTQ